MKQLKIGRNVDNDIVFENDFTVSREHATIFIEGNQKFIVDHNSANGTYVNGNKVEGKTLLADHDVIKVGNSLVPWMHYISKLNNEQKEDVPIETKIEVPEEKNEKSPLPGAGSVLTLGILSICLMGLIGLILAIVGLSESSSAEKKRKLNPVHYTNKSLNQLENGKICCYVGLSLSILVMIIMFFSMSL